MSAISINHYFGNRDCRGRTTVSGSTFVTTGGAHTAKHKIFYHQSQKPWQMNTACKIKETQLLYLNLYYNMPTLSPK